MELTGLKPVSFLGLSQIPRGQSCLQKLTMEKLPLTLVLTLTSAITFLSTWGKGQGGKPHTQGSLVQQMKVHRPRSALPLDLSTSGTTGRQETPALHLASSNTACGVTVHTQAAGDTPRYSGL